MTPNPNDFADMMLFCSVGTALIMLLAVSLAYIIEEL